ncbi:MAG TPA: alpha/beta hydrolase [Acidimicrobiia bacterium]|nr:alpha/beta hydrolase [Acidimicrobiia bacterium]
MDTELEAIVARLPAFEPGGPADARARTRAYIERSGLAAEGRDTLTITDRAVPGRRGAPDVGVRVYEPPSRAGSSPCLVYFHGGGFIAGDLDTEDARCVRLTKDAGCVTVSVDYRLAPEHPYPAAVDDSYAALLWVASSADELGVDAVRLGVGGGSAGGTLAAAVALMARDRGGPPLAFQLLLYPALDDRMLTPSARFVGTPLVDGDASARAWDYYLGDRRSEVSSYAAPARADDLANLPTTYLMTAELDPLRDEGIEYAVRLLHAGVSVELHQFGGAFHGFDLLPSAISRRAADEQVHWLRSVTQSGTDHRGESP